MTRSNGADDSWGAEGALDEIVADYVDRLNAGEMLDREEILREHPEFAEEVLERLQVFQTAGASMAQEQPVGTLGDYTLRRQIGRGGMGVVYEAWENSMDRAVALKVLPPGVAADERALQRFVREAKTAGQLNHANVVSVYSTGVREGTPWYAMEYVEGETLAQLLARVRDAKPGADTPFGSKDEVDYFANLVRAFADVADGLQHAHSKGVVHRDIKPSNLILDTEGRLRILDFGLARLEGQESLTLSGDFVGTPLYMSPEQARRKKIPVDHRTDVYSLGASMYETVCGRPPFRGKDHADTLSQIIERDPIEPQKVSPPVPKDLETIVLKCLRKNASDRYGTAEALAQDLRRFVRGDRVEARPQGKWEKLWIRAARSRFRIAIACLILALLGAVRWSVAIQIEKYAFEKERRYDNIVEHAAMNLQLGLQTGQFGGGHLELRQTLSRLLRGNLTGLAGKQTIDPVEAALIELEEARNLLPRRPDSYYHRGKGLLLMGREEKAVRELEQALSVAPDFEPAIALLRATVKHRGDMHKETGEPEGTGSPRTKWAQLWSRAHGAMVTAHWTEALEAHTQLYWLGRESGRPFYAGSDVESLLGRGMASLELREYEVAIGAFYVARDRWPEALAPNLLLGQAYFWSGDEEQAEKVLNDLFAQAGDVRDLVALEAAIIIATRQFYLQDERAFHWLERIEDEFLRERAVACLLVWSALSDAAARALKACEKALRIRPEDPLTHAVLAVAHALGGTGASTVETIQHSIERAIDLAGDDRDIAILLGDACREAGAYDRAMEMYRRNPTGWGLIMLGLTEKLRGNTDEAINHLEAFLRIYPNSSYACAQLGEAYATKGDQEKALRLIDRGIELYPQHPFPHCAKGRAFKHLKELSRATECFRRATEVSPRYWFAHADIAEVKEHEGKVLEAFRRYRRALEIEPYHMRSHKNLVRIVRESIPRAETAGSSGESSPGEEPGLHAELNNLIQLLEVRLRAGKESPDLYHTLAVALMHADGSDGLDEALRYASLAVEKSKVAEGRFVRTLKEIESAQKERSAR